MKKILSVVLVLIMVAGGLAACGYSTSPGLLRTFADALNKQDTEAMADCWYNADEGEMEIILNIFKLGYEVIYGKINKIELTSYKMTKEEEDKSEKYVASKLRVYAVEFTVHYEDDGKTGSKIESMNLSTIKVGDRWYLSYITSISGTGEKKPNS